MKPILNITVKLLGKDGNVFFIIARVQGEMKKANVEKEIIDSFIKEAMQGDYDNVLKICMKYVKVI